VNILCNSYIYASQKQRLFVRDDAFSNPKLKGNKAIEFLQDSELKEMRVSGSLVVTRSHSWVTGVDCSWF
jgi:hypothetical protein